jgi:hypothetical protein
MILLKLLLILKEKKINSNFDPFLQFHIYKPRQMDLILNNYPHSPTLCTKATAQPFEQNFEKLSGSKMAVAF